MTDDELYLAAWALFIDEQPLDAALAVGAIERAAGVLKAQEQFLADMARREAERN